MSVRPRNRIIYLKANSFHGCLVTAMLEILILEKGKLPFPVLVKGYLDVTNEDGG